MKAPSANNLLKKLGILKATKKASISPLPPNIVAKVMSRINPSIREAKVQDEMRIPDFRGLDFFTYIFVMERLRFIMPMNNISAQKDARGISPAN